MPLAQPVAENLLDPISSGEPSGANLRWTAEWDRIAEARRSDDDLDPGKWAKRERKSANWRLVAELTSSVLRTQSKDLQIAIWFAEANFKLHGFRGLHDGLHLVRELIIRYWDHGLYPPIEEGLEYRAGPLLWLNDKLVDALVTVPITRRSDAGNDYSLAALREARRVGSEASYRSEDGDIDEQKKKDYDDAVAAGRVSMEMFQRAFQNTELVAYEALSSEVEQLYDRFRALEKVIEEKYGDAAPGLSDCRNMLGELKQEISILLEKKRKDQPVPEIPDHEAPALPPLSDEAITGRFPFSGLRVPTDTVPTEMNGSWYEAEQLIRSGQVEAGLSAMTRLAAGETSGRNRFQRKLLLAEVCLASRRNNLARAILEELAEQIDKFQLESWEASDLIGSVWTRLHQMYKQGTPSDNDRAKKLFERLCRLDPWQALACSE